MSKYKINKFPKTRIATFDVCSIGKKMHHVTILLECDVTDSRIKIKHLKGKELKSLLLPG